MSISFQCGNRGFRRCRLMFVNSRHNGVLSSAFSQVSASPSPSAFPLLKVPDYRIQTRVARLARGLWRNKISQIFSCSLSRHLVSWGYGMALGNSKTTCLSHKSNKIVVIPFYFFFSTPLSYRFSSPSTIRYGEYFNIFLEQTVTVPLKIRNFPPKYSIEVNSVPRLSHSKDIISCENHF